MAMAQPVQLDIDMALQYPQAGRLTSPVRS
jgi:hypothetical protein